MEAVLLIALVLGTWIMFARLLGRLETEIDGGDGGAGGCGDGAGDGGGD